MEGIQEHIIKTNDKNSKTPHYGKPFIIIHHITQQLYVLSGIPGSPPSISTLTVYTDCDDDDDNSDDELLGRFYAPNLRLPPHRLVSFPRRPRRGAEAP
jgi:hypothetical protein